MGSLSYEFLKNYYNGYKEPITVPNTNIELANSFITVNYHQYHGYAQLPLPRFDTIIGLLKLFIT